MTLRSPAPADTGGPNAWLRPALKRGRLGRRCEAAVGGLVAGRLVRAA